MKYLEIEKDTKPSFPFMTLQALPNTLYCILNTIFMPAPGTRKLFANTSIPKKDVLLANFIGGIAWGLGTVIGATVIVAILVYGLTILGLFDSVKDFFPSNFNK